MEKIYGDQVCFQVGPYDTVTIRFLPTHLEIICESIAGSNLQCIRIDCTEEDPYQLGGMPVHRERDQGGHFSH